jgi:hypothetical protein
MTLSGLVVLSVLALGCMGCGGKTQTAANQSDSGYTLSIPNERIVTHNCTTVMSFPRVSQGAVTIPAQSLQRCDNNSLALRDDETGDFYTSDGRSWMQ